MLQISTLTDAKLAEERYLADCEWRGITPDLTLPQEFQASEQMQGKPMPIKTQTYKLAHIWHIGQDVYTVESCGKDCRVCHPDHGPYEYTVLFGKEA